MITVTGPQRSSACEFIPPYLLSWMPTSFWTCCRECMQNGTLDKYNVELLGAKLPSINRAEDRNLFKEAMTRIGLKTPRSGIANNMEEALKVHTVPFKSLDTGLGRLNQLCSAGTAVSKKRSPHCCKALVLNMQVHEEIGRFPLIIRPAFTLGGTGGGIAYNMEEYQDIIHQGLTASMTNQVLQGVQ